MTEMRKFMSLVESFNFDAVHNISPDKHVINIYSSNSNMLIGYIQVTYDGSHNAPVTTLKAVSNMGYEHEHVDVVDEPEDDDVIPMRQKQARDRRDQEYNRQYRDFEDKRDSKVVKVVKAKGWDSKAMIQPVMTQLFPALMQAWNHEDNLDKARHDRAQGYGEDWSSGSANELQAAFADWDDDEGQDEDDMG